MIYSDTTSDWVKIYASQTPISLSKLCDDYFVDFCIHLGYEHYEVTNNIRLGKTNAVISCFLCKQNLQALKFNLVP